MYTQLRKMYSKKRYILSKKETFLNKALDEGNKFLIVIDNCCEKFRNDSLEQRRILTLIDRYSRYKVQLREDFDDLRTYFVDVEGILVDNEQFLEDEMEVMDEWEDHEEPEDMMEVDQEFMEDFDEDDSVDDIIFDEHVRFLKHVTERKHILAHMESVIIRTLIADRSLAKLQLSIHVQLKSALEKYCAKVSAILKRNEKFMKSLRGSKGLVKSVQDKYQELKLLLIRVNERRMFFSSIFN